MTVRLRLRALTAVGALLGVLAPLGVLGPLAAVAAPADAAEAASPDCSQVYAGPRIAPGHANTGYFDLDGRAGRTQRHALVVANPAGVACTVHLSRAVGRTAVNSGNAYATADDGKCTGVGCWVEDLPASVRVGARSRTTVPFSVHVPAGTEPGQYLAGIVASPNTSAAATPGSQVRMRVTTRVAVGVAVEVAGALTPALAIPSVTVDTSAPPARTIRILERNTGNTWEHPSGTFTVQVDGKTVRLPLTSNTVLGHQSATLSLGAEQVAAGTYPARVELHYANGAKTAVWTGDLAFGAPPSVSRDGSTVVVTDSATPWWTTALIIAAGALALLVLLLLLLLLRRRRRPQENRRPAVP